MPVFLDAVRINSGKTLSNQGSHHAIRLAALDSMTRERLLAPAPAHVGPERFECGDRSLVCDITPAGQPLRTYFLEGATGARFEQIRLAPGQQSIPALTHPQALAVCSAGNWYGGGDSRTFRLEEQWEWLNPGKHLSLATTIRGEVACLLADCWLQFLPESPSTSEFWLVRDGLLLGPLPFVQAPPGCRVIATAPQLPIESDQMTIKSEEGLAELQAQLNEKIRRLYTTVKTD